MSSSAETTLPETIDLAADDEINLVILYNPLDTSQRTIEKLVWREEASLASYLDGLPDTIKWVTVLNDRVIDATEWSTTYAKPKDFLVIVPVPEGGGGGGGSSGNGKMIMRLVAMVAIVVASFFTFGAASVIGMTTLFGSETAASIAGVVMATAGSMLVNAVMPATAATTDNTASTPTYGIDGPKNTSTEDIVVPLVYGTYMLAGNVTDIGVENSGDVQTLSMRSVIGEGPVKLIDLDNMIIQNQHRTSFTNLSTWSNLGYNNQTPSPWFNEVQRYANQGVELIKGNFDGAGGGPGSGFLGYTTSTPVDGFRLDFLFPNGLVQSDPSSGKRETKTVEIWVFYRPYGTTGWSAIPLDGAYNYPYAPSSTTQAPDGQNVQSGGYFKVSGSQKSALRMSYLSPPLIRQAYDIFIARLDDTSSSVDQTDDCYISDFVERIWDPIQLNWTAYYAVRIQLDDQLSQQPETLVPVQGLLVNHFDQKGVATVFDWSNNPADVALDLMSNTRYGAALALTRFDWPAFFAWRTFCAANGLVFNGVFDQQSNLWDCLQYVMRVGHANIAMNGTKFSVVMETLSSPVMMFGMGNIIQGTMKLNWLQLTDRANEVEVEYYDKDDLYRQHIVRAVDADSLARGDPQRLTTIQMIGVTDPVQAFIEASISLNLNKYLLQTIQFDAPLEAVACALGDVVLVQHDMPQWGFGGRLAPDGSTTTTIYLDKAVPMTGGTPYQILVMHPAVELQGGLTVTSIVTSSIWVNTATVNQAAKRLVNQAGKDAMILAMNPNVTAGTTEIIIDHTAGFSTGDTVQLWQTEYIDTQPVHNPGTGEYSILTLTSPLVVTPIPYSNWMFGPVVTGQKPFRVRQINGTHEVKRTIIGLEYNESVWTDPLDPSPTPNYTIKQPGVGQVSNVRWFEEQYNVGPAIHSRMVLTWTPPGSGRQTVDGFVVSAVNTTDKTLTLTTPAPVNTNTIQNPSGHGASVLNQSTDGLTLTLRSVSGFSIGDTCKITTFVAMTGNYAGANVQLSYDGVKYTKHLHVGNNASTVDIDVVKGQVLNFRIVPFDNSGHSAPINLAQINNYTVIGKNTSPSLATNLTTTTNQFEQVTLSWAAPGDPDVDYYHVYHNTTNNLSTATLIAEQIRSTRYVHTGLGESASKYYWIKVVDHDGNTSAANTATTAGTLGQTLPGLSKQHIVLQALPYSRIDNSVDLANMAADPSFNDADLWGGVTGIWSFAGAGASQAVSMGGKNAIIANLSSLGTPSGAQPGVAGVAIKCEQNTYYRLRIQAKSAGSANKVAYLQLNFLDGAGNFLSNYASSNLAPASYSGTVGQAIELVFPTPANTASMQPAVIINDGGTGSAAGAGSWTFTNIRIDRQATGSSITSAAVTSTHLAASSVTAPAIATGAVGSSAIAAGAVTYAHLSSGSAVTNIGYTPLDIFGSNQMLKSLLVREGASGMPAVAFASDTTSGITNSPLWGSDNQGQKLNIIAQSTIVASFDIGSMYLTNTTGNAPTLTLFRIDHNSGTPNGSLLGTVAFHGHSNGLNDIIFAQVTGTAKTVGSPNTNVGQLDLGVYNTPGSGMTNYLEITPATVNLINSAVLQINGTTAIDASRNGSFVNLTATGTVSLGTSLAFTGTPTAPTAAVNTNTTQLATTAFVLGQAATANPLSAGSVAPGTSLLYARQDHVHPVDTSRIATSQLGAASGVATLTTGSVLTTSQMPALTGVVTTAGGSLTTSIGAAAITSTMLAAGAAAANLGYTPLDLAGTNHMTAQLPVITGSLGTPSIGFNTDLTTGMRRYAAGQISFDSAGVEMMRLANNQMFYFNSGATANITTVRTDAVSVASNIGQFNFQGANSVGTTKQFGHFHGIAQVPTSGSEQGRIDTFVMVGGTETVLTRLDGQTSAFNLINSAVLQINGATAIDASRNGSFAGLTVTGALSLPTGAVTSTMIGSGAVSSAALATGAVGSSALASGLTLAGTTTVQTAGTALLALNNTNTLASTANVGQINGTGLNASAGAVTYTQIIMNALVTTAGSEQGRINFNVMNGSGSLSNALRVDPGIVNLPSGAVLQMSGSQVIDGSRNINVLHLTGIGTAPSIATSTGAGSGTGLASSISGRDLGGSLSITTGATTPTAAATIATITFGTAFASAPNAVHLAPANAAAAALTGGTAVYVDLASITTGVFVIKAGSAALAASTTYKWFYSVIG